MANNQFDTIYHEHFSYLSFLTTERIFSKHGMRLFDVEQIPTHGGSLRIYACHEDDPRLSTPRVESLKTDECAAGLDSIEAYLHFPEKVHATKRNILSFFVTAKEENKRIVGYGAPAKGNTLLNYCGIRGDYIDFTVDRNPYKQDRFLPGTHIPILAPENIRDYRPDYVFILPWNIKDEIMEQLAFIRQWGGKFVVPIPQVRIYA